MSDYNDKKGKNKTHFNPLMAQVRFNIGLGNEEEKVMRAEIIERKHGAQRAEKEEELVILIGEIHGVS